MQRRTKHCWHNIFAGVKDLQTVVSSQGSKKALRVSREASPVAALLDGGAVVYLLKTREPHVEFQRKYFLLMRATHLQV